MTAVAGQTRRHARAALALLWIVLTPARPARAADASATVAGSAPPVPAPATADAPPAAPRAAGSAPVATAPVARNAPVTAAPAASNLPVSPAASAVPVTGDIRITEDGARWENAYGEKFFQVVGSLTNGGTAPVGAVRVRVELLDASGAVVETFEGWNARAEALGDLDDGAAREQLRELAPSAIAPGESDRFRSTFLADETPEFRSHRVRVVAVLPPA